VVSTASLHPTPGAAKAAARLDWATVFSAVGLQKYQLSGVVGRIRGIQNALPVASALRDAIAFPNKQGTLA